MAKFAKYWLPAILWAALIFYLSSIPGLKSGMALFWDVFLRKLAHASEFAVLNFLIFWALTGYQMKHKKALLLSFLLAVLYAFSDELHQYFVPERECRLKDIGVDSLGAVFASACLIFYKCKKKK